MYSLPSASKIWEPWPRRMKGASPPTEPKARTGELTPPGIIRSARCCSWRDISILRVMGSPKGNWSYMVTAGSTSAGVTTSMSNEVTEFIEYLQSCNNPETRSRYSLFSTRPSNREGFEDSFGGLRAVPIFLGWRQQCLHRFGAAISDMSG